MMGFGLVGLGSVEWVAEKMGYSKGLCFQIVGSWDLELLGFGVF